MAGVELLEQPNEEIRSPGRRHAIRVAALAGWGVVLTLQTVTTVKSPGFANLVAEAGLVILFVLVNVQLVLMRWLGHKNWRRVTGRLHGSAYLSEKHDLPNRNYVLAELRREMPRARTNESPFVLVQLSLDNISEVRERRGVDFADRATNALVETLKRLTRSSDFLAHLGEARFCVMLVDCTAEQSAIFLQRVPGTISVSDGRQMFDVPVAARVHQYDMEALYATDVLREVEAVQPLRRREAPRPNSLVA
jgi:diguanylate cyclase (GGDEF)-like protein